MGGGATDGRVRAHRALLTRVFAEARFRSMNAQRAPLSTTGACLFVCVCVRGCTCVRAWGCRCVRACANECKVRDGGERIPKSPSATTRRISPYSFSFFFFIFCNSIRRPFARGSSHPPRRWRSVKKPNCLTGVVIRISSGTGTQSVRSYTSRRSPLYTGTYNTH